MVHFSFSPRIQFFFGQILILLALLCLFRCKSYERAKKKLTIEEAPNILTIALKRYQVPSRLSLSSNIYILKVLYEVMNTVLAIEMATTCAIEEWNFCSFMYLVGIEFCWDTLNNCPFMCSLASLERSAKPSDFQKPSTCFAIWTQILMTYRRFTASMQWLSIMMSWMLPSLAIMYVMLKIHRESGLRQTTVRYAYSLWTSHGSALMNRACLEWWFWVPNF